MDNKNQSQDSQIIAGKIYNVEDYKRKDTVSSGIAETHEQVSDTFMEGATEAVIMEGMSESVISDTNDK